MKVLYICTHNRCRSILSEAITRKLAHGELIAQSAGSAPSGEVHPLSLRYLHEAGISTVGLFSKFWHDLAGFSPDVVITLCDSAASEPCPVWLGSAIRLHLGLADPSKVAGDEAAIAQAFRHCMAKITQRTQALQRIAAQPRESWREALMNLEEEVKNGAI